MNHRFLPEADGEAIKTALWYNHRQRGLGAEFLAELQTSVRTLCADPQNAPLLEYYIGPHEIRRTILRRFPYVVVALCRPDEIVIVAVSHTRRRPLYWLRRLGRPS